MSGIQMAFLSTGSASFSPAGGDTSGTAVLLEYTGIASASITIFASEIAVWNWTKLTGTGTVNVANGGSASSITFSITAPAGFARNSTFSVSGTIGSLTQYWSINITADFT